MITQMNMGLEGDGARHIKVADLPEREQPINRVRDVGAEYVSLTELLATIVQTGDAMRIADDLVCEFGSLHNISRADESQLTEIDGVGSAQAARLHAALELGRRLDLEKATERSQIKSPVDAFKILSPLIGHKEQEHFTIVYLNTRNRVLDVEVMYVGSINTSLVRTAEVFKNAVRRNCVAIIVAHNHPSGDPSPSPEDVQLTRRLVEAGRLLEVNVVDHLVVGHNRYISLRERGVGFEAAGE